MAVIKQFARSMQVWPKVAITFGHDNLTLIQLTAMIEERGGRLYHRQLNSGGFEVGLPSIYDWNIFAQMILDKTERKAYWTMLRPINELPDDLILQSPHK